MGIQELYSIFRNSRGITTDTRNIFPDSIFFALKGETFDGNKFAQDAIKKGASYAIIDDSNYKYNNKFILVNDVLHTLQSLAKVHINTLKPKLKVIGLTGSNGKTTTKEVMAAILSEKYNTGYTQGNFNNHIGVPLTILALNEAHEVAIIEMGANHVGEIKLLASIAMPDYGLITNIGKAHLEGFGSIEGIIKGKLELFEQIEKTDGTCFVNANSTELMTHTKKFACKKIYYGNTKPSYLNGYVSDNTEQHLRIDVLSDNQKIDVQTNLIGDYNLDNILAGLAIGKYFGIEVEKMREAIENYTPTNNRSQFIQTSTNRIIMDAYNANPSSMEASIQNFEKKISPNKLAILGEMKELGAYSNEAHRKIVDLLKLHGIKALLIGNEFKPFHQISGIFYFENTDKLIEWIKFNRILDSDILIKGSRSNKLEKIIEYL